MPPYSAMKKDFTPEDYELFSDLRRLCCWDDEQIEFLKALMRGEHLNDNFLESI